MLTGFQLRAAKETLGLTSKDIATSIGVHYGTIIRLCGTSNLDYLSCSVKTSSLLRNFFEEKDYIFKYGNCISLKNDFKYTINPNSNKKLTRFQLKAARIATTLTQEELSYYLKVSSSTLSLLENLNNMDYIESSKINIQTLKKFFELIGISFPDNLSICLKKDPQKLAKQNLNSV
jgi:DNA-binding XRE family transcriptional regulator